MFNSLRSLLKFRDKSRNRLAVVHAHPGTSDAVWHDTEPLMDVVEGNEESDWVLWENSVASVDSSDKSPVVEVFGSVGKNSS